MERLHAPPSAWNRLLLRFTCALGLLLAAFQSAQAGHIAGGSISYQCLGGDNYQLTLDLFYDCSGIDALGQVLHVESACGTVIVDTIPPPPSVDVSQLCPSSLPNSTCNGGGLLGIQYYQFQAVVNIPPCPGGWHVYWETCCRALTRDLIGTQGTFIDATIHNDILPCNNSPVFTDQSMPYVCLGQEVNYNFGVTEPDGNTLVYSLISARKMVANVEQLVAYQPGYTANTPIPGIVIDPVTGQLTFTPPLLGNYDVVIQVAEYDASGVLIGTVMRDITFAVMVCNGSPPVVQADASVTGPGGPGDPPIANTATVLSPNNIEVCDGGAFCFSVTFSDADPVNILNITSQAAALMPGSITTVSGDNPATATICWTGDATNSPVNVLLQVSDGACPVVNRASVAVNITSVVAAPVSAGGNGSLQVCPGAGTFNLVTVLGGTPDAGGTWTAPNGTAHAATFNPATDVAGVYTYHVGNTCANASATATISFAAAAPNAGANGTLSICSSATPVALFNSLGGSPMATGTWTDPSNAAFAGTYNPAVHGPGVYTYTVGGSGGCPSATATVTVTEVPAANAGTNGTLSICSSAGAVALFNSLGGTPASGGTWTAAGPVAHGANYNPAVDASGVFTYAVLGAAPCLNATATVTVTETAAPNAGIDGTLSICSSGAATNLFTALTGSPQGTGSWTDPSNAAFSGTYDPAVNASGVYTYTVAASGSCAGDVSTVTVTEVPAANAGSNGTLSICGTAAAVQLFNSLGGTPDVGGTWTAAGPVAHGPTYDPAVDASGVFTYAVLGAAPCLNATATVTVTETAAPNAGIDGTLSICSSGAATNLFTALTGSPQGTGSWTDPSNAAFSGTYDPAVNASGVYTYTVAASGSCAGDVSTVTVTEVPAANAGSNGTLSICGTAAAVQLFNSLGGTPDVGGTWTAAGPVAHGPTYDPAVDASGVFTYAVLGAAPCLNATATVTVTETAAPNAGIDGTLSICSSGAAMNLFTALTGSPQGTGSWTDPSNAAFSGTYDPAVNASGVYTYTVAASGSCAGDVSTVTVTEVPAANAGSNGTLSICGTAAAVQLFNSLGGTPDVGGTWTAAGPVAHGPTYDPAVDASGVFTYAVLGAAPCLNATATVTVTETAAPNAGIDGTLSICSSGAATNLFTALTGSPQGTGSWTDPSNAAFSGNYDPALNAPGIYTYTVPASGSCAADVSTVTVSETAAANAGIDGTLSICSSGAPTNLFTLLTGSAQGTGSWTDPSSAAFSGTYDPAVNGTGVYTYTIPASGSCAGDVSTVTVTEHTAPNAGGDGTLSICSTSAATNLFSSLTGAQGTGSWTDPANAAFNGIYDPSVNGSGTYTYTVIGVAPCVNDVSIVTVTETLAPNAGANGSLNTCSNAGTTALFPLLAGAQIGGTWTDPSNAPFSGTYDPAVNVAGNYTYTLPASGACAADMAVVNVAENTAPYAGVDGTLSICSTGGATNLFALITGAPQGGGTWTDPANAPFSGTYDPAVNASGTYTYTVNGAAPCANDAATVVVTENLATDAGNSTSLNICSAGTAANLFALLGAGAQSGGAWTDPANAPFSGSYDPAVNASGVYTYTVTGNAPCVNDVATVNVTETPAANAGADAVLNTCSNSPSTNLFGLLVGAQGGGSWTNSSGMFFNGTYAPATSVPDTYIYTVTGTGPCANDQAGVIVNEISGPNAGADAILSVCSANAPTNLFTQLAGAQGGGTWTGPGGLPFSGNYDTQVDAAGTYTYTVPGSGGCPADQADVTVSETQAPNAGTDAVISLCSASASSNLFALLGVADVGGTWTGPGALPFSGTYVPATNSSGSYIYTVPGAAPCLPDHATVVVTENPAPNAGGDGTLTICDQGAATSLFNRLTGTPDLGGTWTDPNGLAHGANYDPATDAPGTYTYTVAGTLPCAADQAVVVVNETGSPNAGVDGGTTLCSTGSTLDLNTLLNGADLGGSWTAPNGTIHSNLLDPSTDGAGSYHYVLSASVPCAGDQSDFAIVINAAPNAGVDGTLTICDQGAATNLFNRLTGAPDMGGTWTDPSGLAHGANYDPATDAPGTYTYTVAGTLPCAADQAVVVVNETGSPNAGVDGGTTLCSTGSTLDLNTLLNGADLGGSWTAPNGTIHSNLLDPSTDGAGSYHYVLSASVPCAGDQSDFAIVINAAPNAGVDGTLTICDQGAATNLFNRLTGTPDAGGTWTDPSGLAHGANYDPATDAPGTYTYTVAGTLPCAADQAMVVVNETGSPNAGNDGGTALCSTSATLDLNTLLNGADLGGSWTAPNGTIHSNLLDPSTDGAGSYHYVLSASVPCAGDQSDFAIVINAAPNAGVDGTLTICDQGAATNLFNRLTGTPDAGGTWTDPNGLAHGANYDPATDAPGTYTYTVAGTLPCAADQAVVVVNETGSPNAGVDGGTTLCSTGSTLDLNTLLNGADLGGSWTAPNGTIHSNLLDPSTDGAGSYHYVLSASVPCAGDQSDFAIVINAAPNAGVDGTLTICDQGAATSLFNRLTGTPDAGGTWTDPSGLAHGANYDPATDAPGTYTYTVAGTLPCAADQAMVVVNETGSPNAGNDGGTALCSTSATLDLNTLLNGADLGGSWTAPNGTIHSNLLDPSTDGAGTYHYVLSASVPCAGDQSDFAIVINAAPNAGVDGTLTICDQGAATSLFNRLTGTPDPGGTWTDPNGLAHGANYDPATDAPGTYTYTVAGTLPCAADQAVVVVNETGSPNAGVDGALTLCNSGVPGDLFAQLTGADIGGSWTAPNGTAHSATLDPAFDASGTYTYTLNGSGPCAGDVSAVVVTVEQPHDAGVNAALPVCTGDAPFLLFDHLAGTPDAGGTWTAPDGTATTGTYDPATMVGGAYAYTVSGGSCTAAIGSVTVTVLPGPNAGQDGSSTLCSSGPVIDLMSVLNGTPAEGGAWTNSEGADVSASFDPATSTPGAYTYTVVGNAACPDAHAVANVAVNEAPVAGTIGIATLCSNGAPLTLFSVLSGAPDAGGTWTGPGGVAFDGVFDPAVDQPGVHTYTVAGVAPCLSASAAVTVEVNTAPNAGTNAAATLCITNAPVALVTLLAGTPDAGGTWTDPSGNAFSGTFDPAAAVTGAYTYHVAGEVPCAAAAATVTMSVAQTIDAGGDGSTSGCSSAAPYALMDVLTGTPDAGGVWTDPAGAVHAGMIDPATDESGTYTYTVMAQSPCPMDQSFVQVQIIAVPVVHPTFSMSTGCVPVEVTFTSGYSGPGSCAWDFGNGTTSTECGPQSVVYDQAGSYPVTFTADPGNGCGTTVTLEQTVNVFVPPVAAFSIVTDGINIHAPIAAFSNGSTGASSFLWHFGDVGTSTLDNPQFTFPYEVEATYSICLIAYSAPTCTDTVCQDLFVPADANVFTPNTFTPDGDGINDGFAPVSLALDPDDYHFYILDRWGQPLYSTEDPDAKWDGNYGNGNPVPIGVYVWKLVAKDSTNGKRFERIGHITLLR